MKKTDCIGCVDDFYNGNNPFSIKECDHFHGKGNRVKVRYRIDFNTPTNIREAYQKISCPTCYRQKGYAFFDRIPCYAQSKEQREMKD